MWKYWNVIFILALLLSGTDSQTSHTARRQRQVLPSWAEGETDQQARLAPITHKSIKDLLGVCDCFLNHPERRTRCSFDIGEYGPLVINGTCFNGTQRRRRRRHSSSDGFPEFPALPWCAGDLPLLLVSSGEKESLHLTNVPSVWVCPFSLGLPLRELSITNVPEIKIAPGALVYRLTDFTFNVTGVVKELDIPQNAFTVDLSGIENVSEAPAIEAEVENSLMPRIKILIENAGLVNFEMMSVSAPRVWVGVRQTEMLVMATNAVKALSYPFDSVLNVSSTKKLIMGTRAATVRKLWVTNTSKVLLREESVEMSVPGCELYMSQVGSVILSERSIILGGGAKLELKNVTLTTLGNLAIQSSSPLSVSSMIGVSVTGHSTTPICLATRHLILKDIVAMMSDHVAVPACLKFSQSLEVGRKEEAPDIVLMKTSSRMMFEEPLLFPDPRCASCSIRSTLPPTVAIKTTSLPIMRRTTASPPLQPPSPVTSHHAHTHTYPPRLGPTHLIPTYSTFTLLVPTQPGPLHLVTIPASPTGSATEQSLEVESHWWEEPQYLGPAAALTLLIVLLLLFCCLYRLHNRSKRATYDLPQTFRSRTFPRTIVTPETLDVSPPGPPLHAHSLAPHAHAHIPAELFVSYHVSPHDYSLHQAAVAQAQPQQEESWRHGRRTPAHVMNTNHLPAADRNPNTAYYNGNHHAIYYHHDRAIMTPEDDCSTSSEITI